MEGKRVLSLPRQEVFQIASRLMGVIALDEEIILKKMALEGIQVAREGGWYRLTWVRDALVRHVGGRIGKNPLEVLLRCYLLIKEGEEREEGDREAA